MRAHGQTSRETPFGCSPVGLSTGRTRGSAERTATSRFRTRCRCNTVRRMPTEIHYHAQPLAPMDADAVVLVGRKSRLLAADVAAHLPAEAAALLPALVEAVSPGDGSVPPRPSWPRGTRAAWWSACCPRAPRGAVAPRPHAIAALLGHHVPNLPQVSLLLCLDMPRRTSPRATPSRALEGVYTRKSSPAKTTQCVAFLAAADAPVPAGVLADVGRAAEGIRHGLPPRRDARPRCAMPSSRKPARSPRAWARSSPSSGAPT